MVPQKQQESDTVLITINRSNNLMTIQQDEMQLSINCPSDEGNIALLKLQESLQRPLKCFLSYHINDASLSRQLLRNYSQPALKAEIREK